VNAPRFIPDRYTRESAFDMFDALSRAWVSAFSEPAPRAPVTILLAHWALETGRGGSMHCYNLGNIKHTPGDGRSWTTFRHNEVIKGKIVWLDETDPFRAYDTLDEGCEDYLATVQKRFSKSWPAVLSGDPAAFSHALKSQSYYTADETAYTRTLVTDLPFQLTDALTCMWTSPTRSRNSDTLCRISTHRSAHSSVIGACKLTGSRGR
jgi:hypothetical protein